YQPRYLGANDQIWRGYDNRYYCRRSDGTTGLIIGGLAGGTLGNVLAPGGSKVLGSIIGGTLGAVIGNSVDRNRVVCR
ncbi:glycine zipper 2TM domain-containing protein, partial [Sandarakinorhabdus limnophila]|uniref:glycine zipper 2TM domain-containing protein n=2 Tax=Sandarakinorhabdus limnophila TaxID=210512 RepID=UPI003137C12A